MGRHSRPARTVSRATPQGENLLAIALLALCEETGRHRFSVMSEEALRVPLHQLEDKFPILAEIARSPDEFERFLSILENKKFVGFYGEHSPTLSVSVEKIRQYLSGCGISQSVIDEHRGIGIALARHIYPAAKRQ